MPLVYVMQFSDRVKVGYTTDFKARKTNIQAHLKQKASHTFSTPAPIEAEALAHKKLEPFRIQGEYYSCSFDKACSAIKEAVEEVGPSIEKGSKYMIFTLRAYRESVVKLDFIASANGRSRNSEINQAIKQYIAQYEKAEGKITQKDLQTLSGEAGD